MNGESLWPRLAGLPLVIEACEFDRLYAVLAYEFERHRARARPGPVLRRLARSPGPRIAEAMATSRASHSKELLCRVSGGWGIRDEFH